jgi:UDP-2,3-diacylglucosamine pyrophosphatase LpxH
MLKNLVLIGMLSLNSLFAKSQSAPIAAPNDSTEIAFASDTQAPMWVETLWLKSHGNKQATQKLFADILQRRPSTLFLLGDVVNLGYSDRQWKPMDAYLQKLRDTGVQVHAVLGNHEVMGQPIKGERKFQQRFPDHVRTGYVRIVDSMAVVLLNSNFKQLTDQENAKQVAWYKKTLQELDNDPSVLFIITGCHHSPYTNSKIVGANKTVQNEFVPAFLASKKSSLFLSGHSHNFEHYKVKGKNFMVIGGGGGLHQPLKNGPDCYPDEAQDYKPLFHYLTVKRNGENLMVNSIQLNKDFKSTAEGKRLEIQRVVEEAVAEVRPATQTP